MNDIYKETIYKIWCPECDKAFYINNGNADDLTVMDVEGAICPHCKAKIPFTDDDDVSYEMGLEILT